MLKMPSLKSFLFSRPAPPPKPSKIEAMIYKYMPSAKSISRYNVALSAAVIYQYINEPEAALHEYGPDLLIHLMNGILLSENSRWYTLGISAFLNLHRMASICEQLLVCVKRCETTQPISYLMLDLFINHSLNIIQVGQLLFEPTKKCSPADPGDAKSEKRAGNKCM
jgi:hypothetical protein